MTGEQLRQEIKKRGYTLRSVAAKMGKAEQNFNTMLKSDDMSSSAMEAAAEVMGISVADFYSSDSIMEIRREARKREKELLRQTSLMAMQSLLTSGKKFSDDLLKDNTYEQCIAKLSVQQAYAMLDEFIRKGIDK